MKPPFSFSTIVRVSVGQYADMLHDNFKPGTVFLFGPWGETGGLLKLTTRGHFITLSCDEVYGRSWIQWPCSKDRIRLDGDKVIFSVS